MGTASQQHIRFLTRSLPLTTNIEDGFDRIVQGITRREESWLFPNESQKSITILTGSLQRRLEDLLTLYPLVYPST